MTYSTTPTLTTHYTCSTCSHHTTHTYIRTHRPTHIHTHPPTHPLTPTHTPTHTYTHNTHLHTYTQTHSPTPTPTPTHCDTTHVVPTLQHLALQRCLPHDFFTLHKRSHKNSGSLSTSEQATTWSRRGEEHATQNVRRDAGTSDVYDVSVALNTAFL